MMEMVSLAAKAIITALPQLRVILETLCGEGNYSATMEEGAYILVVKIGLTAKKNFDSVASMLNRVVPENILYQLSQLYNTHMEVGQFTHSQLGAYTHDQLRNAINQGSYCSDCGQAFHTPFIKFFV